MEQHLTILRTTNVVKRDEELPLVNNTSNLASFQDNKYVVEILFASPKI